MKIGIFGGTFDPPHVGHMQAASSAAKQIGLDLLYIVPAGIPPHKTLPENSPGGEMRFFMTCLAAQEVQNAVVSGMEIAREGKSYTIDTIEAIAARHPKAGLYLFLGTDMFLAIEKWHRFEEILKKTILTVFARTDGENGELQAFSKYLAESYGAKIEVIRHEIISVSSSEIREKLNRREGREFLSDDVYAYIIRNGLFDARPEFAWLRQKAYAKLNPKRVAHVAGCEKEAVKLAKRWGASEEDAREAAILHDITKNLNLAEQLILCDKYGIITDNFEKKDVKLLHAKTGAALAKEEFSVGEEVYNAIYWHTTGKENMSLLEQIIYMADYIEPTRDFDGVERLRQLAYEDLRKALLVGFEMSLEDMRSRGIVPHGTTQRAMDWLASHTGEN